MGIPSKGRMAEDTQGLLKSCQLSVRKLNPRQYAAEIPNVPGMEVWFQRATDVVRKLLTGDVDIGIVGYDMLREIGNEDEDLVIVHDALGFGGCHLAVAGVGERELVEPVEIRPEIFQGETVASGHGVRERRDAVF